MGTNDVLGDFNRPLQSPPLLGHAHPMPVCSVSSQDVNFLELVLLTGPLTVVIRESVKRWTLRGPEGWIFHCLCLTSSQSLLNKRGGKSFFAFPLCLSGVLPRAGFALCVNNMIEKNYSFSCELQRLKQYMNQHLSWSQSTTISYF